MKKFTLTEPQIREIIDVSYNNSKPDTIKWLKTVLVESEDSSIISELCKKLPNDYDLGREIRKYNNKITDE